MNVDLTGKTAVVTGASSGMGLATARALAGSGARVLMIGRSEATAKEAEELVAAGHTVESVRLDVADHAAMRAAYETATGWTGSLDIAVHAAGVVFPGSIADADPAQLKETIDANLLGVMYGSQLALQRMTAGGYIINVSSTSGRAPSKVAAYCASKFGVTGFTECLRIEAAPKEVRVTCLEPGQVWSNFNRAMPEEFQQMRREAFSLTSEEIADLILAMVGLPAHVNVGEMVVRPINQTA